MSQSDPVSPPEPPAELPAYVMDPLARQDLPALQAVADYVDELIAYREAAATRPPDAAELVDDDEDLVTADDGDAGTRVVKRVPCGKEGCSQCPHGPYAYRVRRVDGELSWTYLGRVEEA